MSDLALVCNQIKKTKGKITLDLDFSVNKGELVSIIGPSGSGKSTALSLICGLESPDSGTISINGVDVTALNAEKRGAAVILPDYSVFPNMTPEQNVAYAMKNRKLSKEETESEVRKLLELVNLRKPDKRKVKELSSQDKYKVALARALASEPQILLLDEATSALDNGSQNKIVELLNSLKNDKTIIIVAHRLSTIIGADKIYMLDNGEILNHGTHRELMKNCEEYRYKISNEYHVQQFLEEYK